MKPDPINIFAPSPSEKKSDQQKPEKLPIQDSQPDVIMKDDNVQQKIPDPQDHTTVWQCPLCVGVQMDMLELSCKNCLRTLDYFEEVLKYPINTLLKQIKIDYENQTPVGGVEEPLLPKSAPEQVTAWKCPKCLVFMAMNEQFCHECCMELQYFENMRGYGLDKLIVQVDQSQLQQVPKQQHKLDQSEEIKQEEQPKEVKTYWRCPID